jgi:hypothetical protein
MPWLYFSLSFVLGVITGFALFSHGSFYRGFAGQVFQGVLSIAGFALIICAFWRYGWKVGVIEIFVVFGASNVGLSLFRYFWKR